MFALFLQPLYGALSDRIGRKWLLIGAGLAAEDACRVAIIDSLTDDPATVAALMDEMARFGIPIEGLHTETGPGVLDVAYFIGAGLLAAIWLGGCAAPEERTDVPYDTRFGDATTMDLYLVGTDQFRSSNR